MEYSQSKYEGNLEFGRYHGRGVLQLPDDYRYEGEFQNGEFHGHGTLFFPEGRLDGEWVCGKQVEGTFTFLNGLVYASTDWTYCTNIDRRYYSETVSPRGLRPAGELPYFDTGIHRVVPLGSYDAGNGSYSPSTGFISAYDNPLDTRIPSEQEQQWIRTRAPTAATKDLSIDRATDRQLNGRDDFVSSPKESKCF